jgi:hypothetical protein
MISRGWVAMGKSIDSLSWSWFLFCPHFLKYHNSHNDKLWGKLTCCFVWLGFMWKVLCMGMWICIPYWDQSMRVVDGYLYNCRICQGLWHVGSRHEGCEWVLLQLSNLPIFMTCGLKERKIIEIWSFIICRLTLIRFARRWRVQ